MISFGWSRLETVFSFFRNEVADAGGFVEFCLKRRWEVKSFSEGSFALRCGEYVGGGWVRDVGKCFFV